MKFQWVAGLYYSNTGIHVHGSANWNEDDVLALPCAAPRGLVPRATPLPAFNDPRQTVFNDVSDREVIVKETELAAFGEASCNFTQELEADGGRRGTPLHAEVRPDLWRRGRRGPRGLRRHTTAGATLNANGQVTDPNFTGAFPMDRAGCPTSTQCPLQYTTLNTSEVALHPEGRPVSPAHAERALLRDLFGRLPDPAASTRPSRRCNALRRPAGPSARPRRRPPMTATG